MEKKTFFRPADWSAFWTATLVSFGVYFYTLGPSVGLEDSGELAVAGDHLGVPHPPGYPIWTMIAWCFCRLFGWVTFRGQPSPAWCISLASAVTGALAAGVTAMLIARSGSDMLRDTATEDHPSNPKRDNWICWAGGVGASLAFAFSPVMWSQSVIVEVYALGALFLMWVLLLTYRWMRQPLDRTLWLLAFVFGLGLTNYQVLLLALIPLVVIVLFKNARLFRDFAIAGIPILLTVYILSLGALSSADHYSTEGDAVIARHWHNTAAASADVRSLLMYASATQQQALAARARAVDDSLRQAEATLAAPTPDRKRLGEQIAAAQAQLSALRTTAAELAEAMKKTVYQDDRKAVVSATLAAADGCLDRFSLIDPQQPADTLRPAIAGLRLNQKNIFITRTPSPALLCGGVGLLVIGALGFLRLCRKARAQAETSPRRGIPFLGIAAAGALLLLALPEGGLATVASLSDVPLVSPRWYAATGAILGFLIVTAFAFAWLFQKEAAGWRDSTVRPFLIAAAAALPAWVVLLIALPAPGGVPPNFHGTLLSFVTPWGVTLGALAALWCMVWGSRRGIIFAAASTVVQLTLTVMMHKGLLLGLEHPTTWWFAWPFFWNFALLLLAWLCLENGLSVAPTIFFAQLGVSFYAYMPIVSDLLNPPMNWGYPRTWEGFKHAISRGQYEQIKPTDIFTSHFIKQLGAYFSDVRMQFTLLAAPLALLPFAHWSLGKGKVRMFNFAAILFVICGVFVFAAELMNREPVGRIDKYLLAAIGIFSLLGFIYMVLDEFDSLLRRAWDERAMLTGWITGCVILGALAFSTAIMAQIILAAFTPENGIPTLTDTLIAASGAILLGLLPPFLWVFRGRRALEQGAGLRSGFDTVSRQWLIGTVLAFLVMSVMLIALANPRGDIQDGFIQKVKFISSHGIFALWMGYGLIFGLEAADRFFKWLRLPRAVARFARVAALGLALATALIPVWENYMNDNLVLLMGAAEQNGHDFGWQFGYYQLEGAKGITPELEREEEPLPNPFYPEAMPKDAFFFGGTDPGRFVPTYMIYSANVRPDVFLVTQNALADKTFMSVTRDLYGDRIWIPSEWDSARIFSTVSDELLSGKRGGADVKVINGRRQVSGAQGVMEINADLAKVIFENNKKKHAFFIEESYVIPWMYPYLTPHGLIMRINAEPTAISPENARDDLDFWDWYTRRLTDRPEYRRDFVAQKSFCKLRTALAGLYNNHRMTRQAERAYIEALWLYPVGPEAIFRYLNDVLIPREAANAPDFLEKSIAFISAYHRRDPNNAQGERFTAYLNELRREQLLIETLTAKIAGGTAATADVAALANLQYKVGNAEAAKSYWKQIAHAPDLTADQCVKGAVTLSRLNEIAAAIPLLNRIPPAAYPALAQDELFALATLAGRANRSETAVDLLKTYLRRDPGNWQAHMNLAIAYWMLGWEKEAVLAAEQAIDIGQNAAAEFLTQNQALKPLLQRLAERSRQSQPRPGAAR